MDTIELEERKDKKEEALEKFKKSKLRKVLIIFVVIGILICVVDFINGKTASGVVAILMTALFVLSYLIWMQIVQEKIKGMRIIATVLAFVLLIPCFALSGSGVGKGSVSWENLILSERLPDPNCRIKEVYTDSGESLNICVGRISKEKYKDYAEECENFGYNVDREVDDVNFNAYDKEGYKLDLWYDEYDKRLSIELQSPIEMKEFQWPVNELAKILPTPKSDMGHMEWEHSGSFLMYIGETSQNDFDTYVSACLDAGFFVDYTRDSTYFYADNSDGYHVSIKYEGFNMMSLQLQGPSEEDDVKNKADEDEQDELGDVEVQENEDDKDIEPEEENTLSTSVTKSTKSGISEEFKSMMDSYEEFFDEYIAFIKKYSASDGTDLDMLADYARYMKKYTETVKKMDEMKDDDMTSEELAYFTEVQNRINQKLIEAAQ